MNTEQIKDRLKALNEALLDKGFVNPRCEFSIYDGEEPEVWVRAYVPQTGGASKNLLENPSGETDEQALDAADKLVAELESVHDYKKSEAVKQLGRAVDAMREAGIEADFVNPLAEQLKAISQNLLTYRGAAQ